MTQPDELITSEIPDVLPVLPLRSTILFPSRVVSVQISQEQNLKLLDGHPKPDDIVAVGALIDPEGRYTRKNLAPVAVAARVLSRIKMGKGLAQVIFQGLRRVKLRKIGAVRPYFQARVQVVEDTGPDSPVTRGLISQVVSLLESLVEIDERFPEELVKVVQLNRENGSRCADLLSDMLPFGFGERRMLLEATEVSARLTLLLELLGREIARSRLAGEMIAKTEAHMDRAQRETLLREQLEIIRMELAAFDPYEAEIAQLERVVDDAPLPLPAAEEVRRQLMRLHHPEIRAREGSTVRGYIDWVLTLPWEKATRERFDLRRAQRVLDDRYFGRENAKKLLVEFLAVRKLAESKRQSILAIVGPPGTGRSSLARTMADVMNRHFVRISMRGVHDPSQLRGQARAFPAARPGRILEGMHEAGVRNPVILLDDLDRLEAENGEATHVVVEALDPTLNHCFLDHYLGVPFDLSHVLFIVTASLPDELPRALWEYTTFIELAGYTEKVKKKVARESIWPEVVEEHGLSKKGVRLTETALRRVMREYTREAGVRELKTQLEKICRRLAVMVAKKSASKLAVDARNLESFLGTPTYAEDQLPSSPQIGATIGLAWTEAGGDLLPIEALLMPGEGRTALTGLLGEVLQESASAAFSYVRSHAEELKIPAASFKTKDLHIHFPEGAIPKDGPSAGVAVATVIASVLSGRPIRNDVAMTGEISLRGQVLPVGGLREKVLAAYRAGIKHVIVPRANERGLDEIPREVRNKLKVHLVGEVSEAFQVALMKRPRAVKSTAASGAKRRKAAKKKGKKTARKRGRRK